MDEEKLIAAIRSAIGGQGTTSPHIDEQADRQLIENVLADLVAPILKLLITRIENVEQKCGDNEDRLQKIIDGVNGVVTANRREGIGSMIREKYGSELEPYGKAYSHYSDGKDLFEDILEDAMGQDELDIDSYMGEKLPMIKARFGKIKIIDDEEPQGETVEVASEPEVKEEPVEEEKPEENDPVKRMMNKVMAAKRGTRAV